MEYFVQIVFVIVAVAVGAVCATLYLKAKMAASVESAKSAAQSEVVRLTERLSASEQLLNQRIQECESLRASNSEQGTKLSEQAARIATLVEQLRMEEQHRDEGQRLLTEQFKHLANEILEDKSKRFTEINKINLDITLGPLQQRLAEFEKKVDETYDKESKQRFSLESEVKRLCLLNTQISTEAVNLTNALKGQTKSQGNWGEMILERVLELSGLVKDREYVVQASHLNEDDRRRQPDVVVNLPDKRHLVIDSKVSLVAYERYCSSDDVAERERAVKEHVRSLRRHVEELSLKQYEKLFALNSLDYVLLFVPIEGAFALAVQNDTTFFVDAFSRNIVVVSPTTLLATMRTVTNIWRQEKQNQNVTEIVRLAGTMYDKLAAFVKDLEDVNSRLGAAQSSYDSAFKKLGTGKGNILATADKIKTLGAKTSKQIPSHLAGEDGEGDEITDEITGNGTPSLFLDAG